MNMLVWETTEQRQACRIKIQIWNIDSIVKFQYSILKLKNRWSTTEQGALSVSSELSSTVWSSATTSFLSDPSPINGYACQWLTDSLTNCRLVNLIDVSLACEDGNSKLVELAFLDRNQIVQPIYRTRVWSLGMLVTNWLPNSLTHSLRNV